MNIGHQILRWLARTRVGNTVAVTLGLVLVVAVAFGAATAETPDQSRPTTVRGVADISTSAPSVNLTSNDPGYMKTAPTATQADRLPGQVAVDEPDQTSTVQTTPASPTATTEPVRTTQTPPPVTTAPEAPTSPQANPNIIPLVIAWDGLKCAQNEAYYTPTVNGPVLLCPLSRTP